MFVFDKNFSCQTLHNVITSRGDRYYSTVVDMNRFILAELNTHRMLAKNSASSRAIPSKKMHKSLRDTPFIPSGFQKQHSGMQGVDYIIDLDNDPNYSEAITDWTLAKDYMQEISMNMDEKGVTKQITNRLLEPFLYHKVLISGSKEGWENFFSQRCPVYQVYDETPCFRSREELIEYFETSNVEYAEYLKNQEDLFWATHNKGSAEIHIMQVAELIWNQYRLEPELYEDRRWILPYDSKLNGTKLFEEFVEETSTMSDLELFGMEKFIKISTAMAARTSYTTVGDESEISYKRLLEIYNHLITANPPHRSPFDHPARVMNKKEYFQYKKQYTICGPLPERIELDIDAGVTTAHSITDFYPEEGYLVTEYGWCTHLRGFIPLRHMIENNLPQI